MDRAASAGPFDASFAHQRANTTFVGGAASSPHDEIESEEKKKVERQAETKGDGGCALLSHFGSLLSLFFRSVGSSFLSVSSRICFAVQFRLETAERNRQQKKNDAAKAAKMCEVSEKLRVGWIVQTQRAAWCSLDLVAH